MRHLFIILLLVVACTTKETKEETTGVVTEKAEEKKETVIKKIHTEELKSLLTQLDQIQLVDVRTPAETEQGYIEGAMLGMNFMDGEFESRIHELDKNKPVVIYCAAGSRSNKAAQLLQKEGFTTVYDYTDGYSGWSTAQ